jgi:hypothetical protein
MTRIIKSFYKKTDKFHPHVKFYVFKCYWCHKEFSKMASDYRQQIKVKKNPYKFCSRPCKSKEIAKQCFPKGKKNPHWKGGETIVDGKYKFIYNTDPETYKKRRYLAEHRVVVEKHLGRKLEPGEHIHHLNGNTFDNRLSNLKILNASEHSKFHLNKTKRICKQISNKSK